MSVTVQLIFIVLNVVLANRAVCIFASASGCLRGPGKLSAAIPITQAGIGVREAG